MTATLKPGIQKACELAYRAHARRYGKTTLLRRVLAAPDADGKIRSVIQHQGETATYALARALATSPAPLHSEETATLVGIKRTSIGRALEGLEAKAEVIKVDGRPRLTDPLFEYCLKTKGMLPADGGDDTG